MSAIQTYFQDFLTNIRLPDNLKKALISAHTELREQLKSDDLTKDLLVESFLQGSYARSTCIKPAPGKKVDVDVIAKEKIGRSWITVAVTAPFSNDYGTAHQLAESCSARQLSPPHLVDVVSDFIS